VIGKPISTLEESCTIPNAKSADPTAKPIPKPAILKAKHLLSLFSILPRDIALLLNLYQLNPASTMITSQIIVASRMAKLGISMSISFVLHLADRS
jgi:hypothetical protein